MKDVEMKNRSASVRSEAARRAVEGSKTVREKRKKVKEQKKSGGVHHHQNLWFHSVSTRGSCGPFCGVLEQEHVDTCHFPSNLDALLADLESTTSHISKRPVFLGDETPYSYPTGHAPSEITIPPPVPPPPSAEALNGTVLDPTDSQYSAQQKGWSQDSSSPPLPQGEEEHVYSFPVKQKSDPSVMSASLGSNLSELDRLLQELSAVQHTTPSFATEEETAPPVPSSSTTHFVQENGVSATGESPVPTETASRSGGRGIEDVRPSVESLLDELESSVPNPAPAPAAVVAAGLTDGQEEETPSQQQARISASSATRELDELMASLSDFKGNKLDSMLGSLQSDLNRLGVQTVAKGVCGACRKPIVGQVVTAMGRTWHPEHFVCTHCQEEIGSRNFFERDGQPYCEKDYHNLFSPRCYYCNGPILDKPITGRCITAMAKKFHPEHFVCAFCLKQLNKGTFKEQNDKPYCQGCFIKLFS
ncbi:hypothetical protein JZ751_027213 [Albula glossodonta]|uniref:LIM zinc-binding domain-containing protein n=1 Tax=Albula glossodonta TaxID=121402 RepID=A0A8T2MWV2_9TELE|nr:hypothetical protein JZ751_027213 [Albula glossodonta]